MLTSHLQTVFFVKAVQWSGSLNTGMRFLSCTATVNPGSKPDQKYAQRRNRQKIRGKNKVKFRTSSKRNSFVCNIPVYYEGVDFKVTGIQFMTVFITRLDVACF